MSKIYSPSQVRSWLECPVKWSLEQEGWRPLWLGKKELAGYLGGAFAAGAAVYHAWLKHPHEGEQEIKEQAVHTGLDELRARQTEDKDLGHQVREGDQALSMSLDIRLTKAIAKYIESRPIPSNWEILDVERPLPEYGNARIDLGARTPLGLVVVDNKVKLTCDARQKGKFLAHYRTSWQMAHYAKGYGQYRKEEVAAYYIALVILEPRFSVELHPFPIKPESLEAWNQSALNVWGRMTWSAPWQNRTHCDPEWGFPCEFGRACHEFMYDEHLMTREYIKHPPRSQR